MSRAFVALDKPFGRHVVVKVLPPELAAGVNRERFRREIQVAAQLQHPHIVPLLSAGEQGDLLWYTMPYIEGESLRAALERKRQLTVREVVRILHDVVHRRRSPTWRRCRARPACLRGEISERSGPVGFVERRRCRTR